jgi:uncharacterized protein (UPF0303 family)
MADDPGPAQRRWPSSDELAAQERDLVWSRFDEDDAWRLGRALVERARAEELPVAVEIQRAGHLLFHAALPGSTPDNDAWLVRKARVVARFHKSSLHVGQLCREAGRTPGEMYLLSETEFSAHGGAFPLTVGGAGVIGSVAVSGLPQLEDHALVVDVLRLNLDAQRR